MKKNQFPPCLTSLTLASLPVLRNVQISSPTRMYDGSTWKGGFVTTWPPTYISE